jgi:beta-glucanase (GH16 family)
MLSLVDSARRALQSLAAATAVATVALSAAPALAAPPAPPSGHVWQQTFGDEFNGVALDPTKWTSCYWWVNGGCTNSGNNELEWYTPGNVTESGGTLKLRAQQQTTLAPDGKTYSYTSGMISSGRSTSLLSTPPKFQFKYGYMEMRAKLPKGQGLWPAFWTLPSSQDWPPEIDVMEALGSRPSDVLTGVFNKDAGGKTVHDATWVTGLADYTADFHTFGVDWEPTSLTWYVDGVERFRVTDPAKIPSEAMYVLADLAVGGNWPGSPDSSTAFPSDFEIDWIRVWQQAAPAASILPDVPTAAAASDAPPAADPAPAAADAAPATAAAVVPAITAQPPTTTKPNATTTAARKHVRRHHPKRSRRHHKG